MPCVPEAMLTFTEISWTRSIAIGPPALIGGTEAEAARVEVSRRLIAAVETASTASAAAAPRPAGNYRWATLAATVILLPLGAAMTYLSSSARRTWCRFRSTRQPARKLFRPVSRTRLRRSKPIFRKNPQDGRGWEVLAPVYLRLGRFDDAVEGAAQRAADIRPERRPARRSGEAIVVAARGVVTPEAKSLFERANAADFDDVMAQYYLGLSAKQEGRRDEALKRWTALMSSAREDAEWVPLVKNALARIDDKDPSLTATGPQAGAAVAPAPEASQVAAAAEMAPAERSQMIEGMVARLAQRMAENGSDVDGWLRLIKAYLVLGERDKALSRRRRCAQARLPATR